MRHRVSVIIPAYNAENSLERCVKSAHAQVVGDVVVEVIVVDDGSTDSTATIARAFGDKVCFLQQENRGQGAARNHGLSVATGDFVAFLDADDYWKEGFIATCFEFLAGHPQAVAVSTAYTLIYQDGTQKDFPHDHDGRPLFAGRPRMLDSFYEFWADRDHVRTGTCLMRMEAVREIGGQREDLRISQDLEFWGMLGTVGNWGFIPIAYWIGDSRQVAAQIGVRRKYSKRRRLCPTVEQWQSRLDSRISAENRPHFEKVRGRVAAGFMYAKIVAGDEKGAKEIFDRYRGSMPPNRTCVWLNRFSRFGYLGWTTGCKLLRLRENSK